MKNKLWVWLTAIILLAASFWIRAQGIPDRAPFDWDQNRDYSQVQRIMSGEWVVLGPVAKGAGGFYLGSFYYYLLVPAFTMMSGSLRALPLTGVAVDALVVPLLFLLLSLIWSRPKAFWVALLWGGSWFLIESSRVSWNVALVPIWSLMTIFSLTRVIGNHSRLAFYTLGLLAGLAFHIHVAVIPLIPVLSLILLKKFHFPVKDWAISAGLSFLPIIPLVVYDLTHGLENLRLARTLFAYQNSFQVPFWDMLIMAVTKLGKVLRGILFTKFADSLILGIIILAMAIKSVFSRQHIIKISGLLIIIPFILVLLLHDIGFPEYYFAPAYLAMMILIIELLFTIRIVAFASLIFALLLNIRAYSFEPMAFSLGAKEQMINSLRVHQVPLDVRLKFNSGREGGFGYLIDRTGIDNQPGADTRIIITDQVDGPLYIDGELATDLLLIGNMKLAVDIVE